MFEKLVCLNSEIAFYLFFHTMSFYYLQEEMGLVLNDILDRVCSKNKENLKNDIAITWINYKSENNVYIKALDLELIIKNLFIQQVL